MAADEVVRRFSESIDTDIQRGAEKNGRRIKGNLDKPTNVLLFQICYWRFLSASH